MFCVWILIFNICQQKRGPWHALSIHCEDDVDHDVDDDEVGDSNDDRDIDDDGVGDGDDDGID